MRFLLHWLLTGFALYVADRLLDGIHIRSGAALLIGALVLGLVNALVRPVLVVNAATIGIVASLLGGFNVHGLMAGIGAAIVTGLVSWIAGWFIGDGKKD